MRGATTKALQQPGAPVCTTPTPESAAGPATPRRIDPTKERFATPLPPSAANVRDAADMLSDAQLAPAAAPIRPLAVNAAAAAGGAAAPASLGARPTLLASLLCERDQRTSSML